MCLNDNSSYVFLVSAINNDIGLHITIITPPFAPLTASVAHSNYKKALVRVHISAK